MTQTPEFVKQDEDGNVKENIIWLCLHLVVVVLLLRTARGWDVAGNGWINQEQEKKQRLGKWERQLGAEPEQSQKVKNTKGGK